MVSFSTLFSACVMGGIEIIALIIAGFLLANNLLNFNLGIGFLAAFSSLVNNLIRNSIYLTNNFIGIKASKVLFDKFEKLNAISNSHINSFNSINDIVFKNITFKYDDKLILENFNFTISKNQKYLIEGPSGCGKSTIAKILLNLYEPVSGNIICNQKVLKGFENQKNLIDKVCYLQATPYIFEDSVKNNITLFDKNPDESKYQKILELLNLQNLEQNKIIDEKEFNLSTGQKQRINIARSLYQGYDFIIFDEAMSNIDKNTSKAIENYMIKQENLTFINITHHATDNSREAYNKVLNL